MPSRGECAGKRSGAWVFRGTRTPVSLVFENLQDMSIDELVEEFGVTREQVQAALQFAAHSAEGRTAVMLVLFDNGTSRTLAWVEPQNWLLDIALDTLTLGRAHLGLALEMSP